MRPKWTGPGSLPFAPDFSRPGPSPAPKQRWPRDPAIQPQGPGKAAPVTRSPNTKHVPPPAPWTLMATPEIDSGSDEGTRAQRGDASWTRSHGWWTEATGSKPRTSATTAVPLCVPVPPGLPPAGFHACTHPRGGGAGADPAPTPSVLCAGRAAAAAKPAHPPSASPGPASLVAPP